MKRREVINRFLNRFGFSLLRVGEIEQVQNELQALTQLINWKLRNSGKREESQFPAECIIFSKDRPLQLHALLCSYFENAENRVPIHVLYNTSNDRYQKAYDELFSMFSGRISSVTRDNPFRQRLTNLLESVLGPKIFFLVDDILFIRRVDLNDFTKFSTDTFVPSLRMGINLTFSYFAQKEQPLPKFLHNVIDDRGKLCWQWDQGQYDWGFPTSLDGHLFSKDEICILAKSLDFQAPNSFEGVLKAFKEIFDLRYGVCYEKSIIVNIPCNRVQTEFDYIHGELHQDLLLDQWEKGMQIDYRKFYGLLNNSVHQEVPFEFIPRPK